MIQTEYLKNIESNDKNGNTRIHIDIDALWNK